LLSGARKGFAPEPEAVSAVVSASRRGGDVVVCDLPRDVPPPARAALELADLTVIVVPAEVRACAAAARVAERLHTFGATAQVVVRGPAPGGLRPEEVAAAVELPLLTSMPYQRGLAAAMEKGRFAVSRGPLATAAHKVLASMGVAA
jgi:MinD superfamily P-loop ATPase